MIDLKKNFLIYGYGVSGRSVSKYLDNKNSNYSIYDDYKNLTNIKNVINKRVFKKKIENFDYIVVSPSIKIDRKHLLYQYKKKIIIDLDFLSNELSNQLIIGVTGTEGKSTTCQYLNQVLSTKYQSIIIGNFGNTILDENNLKNKLGKLDIIIIELSSYQLTKLRYLQLSYAIITNIYADHLSYHVSFTKYVKAKFKIIRFLNSRGILILNHEVFLNHSKNLNMINKDRVFKVNIIKNRKNYLENNIQDLNAQLTEKIVKKIDKSLSIKQIKFKNLPFRNQLIKVNKKIRIYNDSKCTNLENAILKNNLISSKNKILILGGMPKPQDCKNIIKDTTVLIFGPFAKKISENIIFYNCKFLNFESLSNLLMFIKMINKDFKFNTILFSPGGESFDLYKDFIDRGIAFNNLIKKLRL
ncbi:Mur ligase family protein [Alphaproteobacteria bacterium]|nr:Mur ligase family protein [Alphaproteobacteria bacterium]